MCYLSGYNGRNFQSTFSTLAMEVMADLTLIIQREAKLQVGIFGSVSQKKQVNRPCPAEDCQGNQKWQNPGLEELTDITNMVHNF